MEYFMNATLGLYQGDCLPGDIEATEQEIADWEASRYVAPEPDLKAILLKQGTITEKAVTDDIARQRAERAETVREK